MMKNLFSQIEDFLRITNGLSAIENGGLLGGKNEVSISAEQKNSFIEALKNQQKSTSVILYVLLFFYVVIFIICMIVLLEFRENVKAFLMILGGAFTSTSGVIAGLHKLLTDKSKRDILISVLPSLPPNEVVKLLQVIYFDKIRKNA